MKILSIKEACTLMSVSSLDEFVSSTSERLCLRGGPYAISPDSGVKAALAKHFAHLLLEDSQVCVYFKNWGVWPSSENHDLFDGYRRSIGELRHVWDAPFHMFVPGEESTFTSILSMGLYFVWDIEVFDLRGRMLFTFSHDEWMEFRLEDQFKIKSIELGLARFELRPLRA